MLSNDEIVSSENYKEVALKKSFETTSDIRELNIQYNILYLNFAL
jgi:hypothetical protein